MSSTYVLRFAGSRGVAKVPCASHQACHFGSIRDGW